MQNFLGSVDGLWPLFLWDSMVNTWSEGNVIQSYNNHSTIPLGSYSSFFTCSLFIIIHHPSYQTLPALSKKTTHKNQIPPTSKKITAAAALCQGARTSNLGTSTTWRMAPWLNRNEKPYEANVPSQGEESLHGAIYLLPKVSVFGKFPHHKPASRWSWKNFVKKLVCFKERG